MLISKARLQPRRSRNYSELKRIESSRSENWNMLNNRKSNWRSLSRHRSNNRNNLINTNRERNLSPLMVRVESDLNAGKWCNRRSIDRPREEINLHTIHKELNCIKTIKPQTSTWGNFFIWLCDIKSDRKYLPTLDSCKVPRMASQFQSSANCLFFFIINSAEVAQQYQFKMNFRFSPSVRCCSLFMFSSAQDTFKNGTRTEVAWINEARH